MSKIVKRQHYIWRKYLTRWADSDDSLKGKVYVRRKKLRGSQEPIEFRELEKIGFEKFYYDVTGFQKKDIIILNQFLSYMQNKELVQLGIEPRVFSEAVNQRDFIEKNIMCPYEDIDNRWNFLEKLSKGDFSFYKDSKKQNILNQIPEEMMSAILYQEDKSSENNILDMLNNFEDTVDDTVDENDLKYEFNRFFCMQYFRSPRIRHDTKFNIEEMKKKSEELNELDTNFFINMVSVYFAERMALNITQNFSTSILLFENKTDIPFITGDTPIVNLTGTEINKETIFYYPISPSIAIGLIVAPKFSPMAKANKNRHLTLEQDLVSIVKEYNQRLVDNCVNEIYSDDKKYLEELNID